MGKPPLDELDLSRTGQLLREPESAPLSEHLPLSDEHAKGLAQVLRCKPTLALTLTLTLTLTLALARTLTLARCCGAILLCPA